ncbi:alpha/beta hydrolase family protein [Amycolatopsis sp. CA-230715]|uniref:alpha/beta hydrolase family protein n=1 Tax=Amycolatopsis sp. CA-230715 TaxID=2745196 RepID=UPI001C00FC95|nr:alpha/beta hydrolase [Amycolatopsis sp. CA-230715]QWF83282.1 Poly(ethylene terephthalate) hydrolase [Amycolatopsis sp. CA-230715]
MRIRSKVAAAVAALAVLGSGVASADAKPAADNPYQRGPDPTMGSIEADRGPFAVTQAPVPAGDGFGGGTVTYPNDTSQGTFGAVAIAPGFLEPEPLLGWLGPRLASQGFVVLTIATNSLVDFPTARADQLLAGLKFLAEKSPAKDRIDKSRLAVMGISMGGGGTLEAAERDPALKAAIPIVPWDIGRSFSGVRTPTLVVAGQGDIIAPTPMHAKAFYDSLSPGLNKAYVEIAGGGHFGPPLPNVPTAKYSISWLKRFVDDDTRYEQFLCPIPKDPQASAFEGNCPHT